MDKNKLDLMLEYSKLCNKHGMTILDTFNLMYDMELFISNIANSKTRVVFMKRYLDGCTWREISLFLGSDHESYPRKIHDTYLKSIGLC